MRHVALMLIVIVVAMISGCPVDDVVARGRCDDAAACVDGN